MSIFSSLREYGGAWSVKEEAKFDKADLASIKSNEVVASQFGLSVCFSMVNGMKKYIPLSSTCELVEGDVMDLKKSKVIILEKEGEEDCVRIEGPEA